MHMKHSVESCIILLVYSIKAKCVLHKVVLGTTVNNKHTKAFKFSILYHFCNVNLIYSLKSVML